MAIAIGICCFINPTLVWQFYVMDSAQIGIEVAQTKYWRRYVYLAGVLLIALGIKGMMLGWTL